MAVCRTAGVFLSQLRDGFRMCPCQLLHQALPAVLAPVYGDEAGHTPDHTGKVAEDVLADLGPCDILVNGAGGNNARANTDNEYFEMADLESDTVTFFDLDESGVAMVFNLNFIGTLLPTQAFARQMVGREGCNKEAPVDTVLSGA